jgi:hypothetical protein
VRTAFFSWLVYLGLAAAEVAAQERSYERTSTYKEDSIQGFAVLLSPQVLAHPPAAEDVRAELARQLKAVDEVVPSEALSALRKVRIWVEWSNRRNTASEFHPSAGWLERNGYNPDKAGDLEISNSLNFLNWSRADQPCMVLHELAHAYHFHVLGTRHSAIAAVYQQAVDSKSYDSVDYVRGGKRRAYALVNEREYFAELSEAYFCRNDYYPFTRVDLQRHDPAGYELLRRLWGDAARTAP